MSIVCDEENFSSEESPNEKKILFSKSEDIVLKLTISSYRPNGGAMLTYISLHQTPKKKRSFGCGAN
jgi:hypothetical protein